MNPLSAFSLGQLIKTFLPGLLASVAPLLVAEALYQQTKHAPRIWQDVFRNSFTHQVIQPNLVGAVTLLVLVALFLGFILNSIHWTLFHDWCRKRCLTDELRAANEELEAVARRALTEVLPDLDRRPAPSVPGFFLATVDLAKHNFLRESYFAWYEFHMNSLAALGLVLLTFIGTSSFLTVYWQLGWWSEAWLILGVVVFGLATMAFLWKGASNNLRIYNERNFWFLIGTLHEAARANAQEQPPRDPWWADVLAALLRPRP